MLRTLPRTARVLVLTGPLFAPALLAGPFAIAYQSALGLGDAQIGLLASAAAGLGLAFLGLGTWASRRWGRLRAMTFFDATGFLLPALLLALARTPFDVAVALLLGATAQGAQAGFQGLLMAEVRGGQRQRVLALEHLLLALPSVAMPLLGGAAVAALGLEQGVRILYVLGAASVGLMMAVRYAALHGRAPPAAPAAGPASMGTTLAGWRGLARAGLAPLLVASALVAFAGGLGVLAQVRVVRVAGLEAWWLGPFATAMVVADLGATALAARSGSARHWAVGGAVAAAAGSLLFLAVDGPGLLLASGAVLGLAGAALGVGTTALLHDAVPEALRDRAVAAQVGLRSLGGFAGPAVGGALFLADPSAPWLLAAAAFAAGGLVLARRQQPTGVVDSSEAGGFSEE